MKSNIYKILSYISLFFLVILWGDMMFFPKDMDKMSFKMLFSFSMIFVAVYSFFKKKYFPQQKHSRKEKILFSILIVLLVVRFLLL